MDKIIKTFGQFEYKSNPDGSIKILGDWQKQNITKLILGKKTLWCHKLIAPVLIEIYKELSDIHLEHEFDLSNGGGCFVPRHITWNPRKLLSNHSWGIALDLNPKKYPYGSKSKPNAKLIEIFENNGFIWGGRWKTPDPMHFEWEEFI